MGTATSETRRELPAEDAKLVDLLTAVLVDPTVHTDLRMRLHRQITSVLRRIQRDLYGRSGAEVHARAVETPGGLPVLLEAVLVDPNLHSDLRIRLHREIRAILRAVQAPRRT
jgi:hypothetical protein